MTTLKRSHELEKNISKENLFTSQNKTSNYLLPNRFRAIIEHQEQNRIGRTIDLSENLILPQSTNIKRPDRILAKVEIISLQPIT